MRISKFHIKVLWFIGLTTITITSFNYNPIGSIWLTALAYLLRTFSVCSLLIWFIGLGDMLSEVVSIKYKLIEEKYYVEVKYLTLYFLFIPCWKPIEQNYHNYETQNVFGATFDSIYTTDVYYIDKNEAIKAIEKHKAQIKKNRLEWFERKKPEVKKVTYI